MIWHSGIAIGSEYQIYTLKNEGNDKKLRKYE